MKAKYLLVAISVLATVGFIDALYLSYARYTHTTLSCSILDGCDIVAGSPHSVLFGMVPLAYVGLLFYAFVLFVCALLWIRWRERFTRTILVIVASAGALSSLYFVYVQAVLIKAFCLYCLISAGVSFLLCGCAVWLYAKRGNTNTPRKEDDAQRSYWTEDDVRALGGCQTYAEVAPVALRVLARMPQPVGELCGPITTGGAGSIEENFKRFDSAIERLRAQGVEIFEVGKTQDTLMRIKKTMPETGYDQALLDDFFLPLFESGFIKTVYMLPDWKSSTGATWEHEQAKRLGIDIVYLSS